MHDACACFLHSGSENFREIGFTEKNEMNQFHEFDFLCTKIYSLEFGEHPSQIFMENHFAGCFESFDTNFCNF